MFDLLIVCSRIQSSGKNKLDFETISRLEDRGFKSNNVIRRSPKIACRTPPLKYFNIIMEHNV